MHKATKTAMKLDVHAATKIGAWLKQEGNITFLVNTSHNLGLAKEEIELLNVISINTCVSGYEDEESKVHAEALDYKEFKKGNTEEETIDLDRVSCQNNLHLCQSK